MDKGFKINVYFQEKGEDIEKIIGIYIMNILDKMDLKEKYFI